MELDKESTESGSHGVNSDLDSPPTSGDVDIDANLAAVSGGAGVADETMPAGASVEKDAVGGTINAAGVGNAGFGGVLSGDALSLMGKKKRGRPRKYDQDGNLTAAYLNRPRSTAIHAAAQPGFTLSTPPSYEYSSSSGGKRGRGRYISGAGGNWQALGSIGEVFANNTTGCDFTPHILTVSTGEDVAGKILTFAHKGPRGVCVLSANGSVSNVMLRQPGSSGGLLTYEGRFEILTLSGSYTMLENGGVKSRTGGLSVSLAGSDGRVIGGGVAGVIMAATPIQIVLGSFSPSGGGGGFNKMKKKRLTSEERMWQPPLTVTAAVPISQAAPPPEHSFFNV